MTQCHKCGVDMPADAVKAWTDHWSEPTGYTKGPRGQRGTHYKYRTRTVYLCPACYARRIRWLWIMAGFAIIAGGAILLGVFAAQRHFADVEDPDEDRRIVDAWNNGRHRTYTELARELRLPTDRVEIAIERHQSRFGKGVRPQQP